MFNWPVIKGSTMFGGILIAAAGTGLTVGSETQISIKDAYAVGAVIFASAVWVVSSHYRLKLLILEKVSETTAAVNSSAASAATAAEHATVSAGRATVSAGHATDAAAHAATAASKAEATAASSVIAFNELKEGLVGIGEKLEKLPCRKSKTRKGCPVK